MAVFSKPLLSAYMRNLQLAFQHSVISGNYTQINQPYYYNLTNSMQADNSDNLNQMNSLLNIVLKAIDDQKKQQEHKIMKKLQELQKTNDDNNRELRDNNRELREELRKVNKGLGDVKDELEKVKDENNKGLGGVKDELEKVKDENNKGLIGVKEEVRKGLDLVKNEQAEIMVEQKNIKVELEKGKKNQDHFQKKINDSIKKESNDREQQNLGIINEQTQINLKLTQSEARENLRKEQTRVNQWFEIFGSVLILAVFVLAVYQAVQNWELVTLVVFAKIIQGFVKNCNQGQTGCSSLFAQQIASLGGKITLVLVLTITFLGLLKQLILWKMRKGLFS